MYLLGKNKNGNESTFKKSTKISKKYYIFERILYFQKSTKCLKKVLFLLCLIYLKKCCFFLISLSVVILTAECVTKKVLFSQTMFLDVLVYCINSGKYYLKIN